MSTAVKKIATARSVKAVTARPVRRKAATTAAARVRKAKVAPKVTAKPAVKSLVSVTEIPAMPLVEPTVEKPAKVKKQKLVRDSFTIPKAEYTVLDDLKQRATKLARPTKKSELLRAGVKALAAMSDVAFLAALKVVPAIKTGRPAKD